MYLIHFRIYDSDNHVLFSLEGSNGVQHFKRWNQLESHDFEPLFILKLISYCLGGGLKYKFELEREIRGTLQQGQTALGWRIEFLNDGYRIKQITYHFNSQKGICNWPKSYSRDKLPYYNDLTRLFNNFVYGYAANHLTTKYTNEGRHFIPRLRSSRFETIFSDHFTCTLPDDWLFRQYINASQYQSFRAKYLYNFTLTLIQEIFKDITSIEWDDNHHLVFGSNSQRKTLQELPQKDKQLINFICDFTRQMADSKRKIENFNQSASMVLMHRMDSLFNQEKLKIFSYFFPNAQFVYSTATDSFRLNDEIVPAPEAAIGIHPWIEVNAARKKRIRQAKNNFLKYRFTQNPVIDEDTVLLIDIDSQIPNGALMKLSAYYKQQGRPVAVLNDFSYQYPSKQVFASCIFHRKYNEIKIKKLKNLYGDKITIGGSGFDNAVRLPDEVESMMPDYALYPNVDFAIGFLTRGCPHKCAFCIVPQKEGNVRQVARVGDLVPASFKKLVLLDDNLLSHPNAGEILRQILKRNLMVNFNQTLDIRYLNPEIAELLLRIDSRNYSFTKRMYYFSLNSSRHIPIVKEKLSLLKGLQRRKMTFICMYGFNTTLSDDLTRFEFLDQMGVLPFVQEFQPIDNTEKPAVPHYFDTDLEPLLKILYPFNGKNFENFLKWVSRKYAETFGELYMPLVDLIFKYNNKQCKHRYIETLAGILKPRERNEFVDFLPLRSNIY